MGETLPPGMALFNKSLRVKNGPDQPNGDHDAVLSHEVFEAIAVTTWLADRLYDRRGPGTNGRSSRSRGLRTIRPGTASTIVELMSGYVVMREQVFVCSHERTWR